MLFVPCAGLVLTVLDVLAAENLINLEEKMKTKADIVIKRIFYGILIAALLTVIILATGIVK